ncbi:MAG: WD40/YVTN/BNR-like repeat-containing protein [Burkholderiaceae bacterium]
MKKAFITLFAFLLLYQNSFAQNSGNNSIKILTQKKGVSIRGMAVPNTNTIWASGSKGSIAKSVNGGTDFEWMQVAGYETRDFRSIHAWDDKEAIIVAIAAPAIILKTKDGGTSWYKVYENTDTLMFLDAIHFKDASNGLVVGDPIGNTIFLLSTSDKGEHWNEVSSSYFKTPLEKGEAFFASSGSNIAQLSKEDFLVSGGMRSRLWINGEAMDIPIIQGGKSTGANSMAISPNGNNIMIVGGDFMKDTSRLENAVGLKLMEEPNSNQEKGQLKRKSLWVLDKYIGHPNGYRSGVEYVSNTLLISCGTSGVDISKNKGKNWDLISIESFHVVRKQPNTKAVFLAGGGGRIGYYSIP